MLLSSGLKRRIEDQWGSNVSFIDCLPQDHGPPLGHQGRMRQPDIVSRFNEQLSSIVYDRIAQDTFTVTIGGDHSVAIGTLTGAARAAREAHNNRQLAVVWVDAHADINTPESSPSGCLHGMPVAFATGLAKAKSFDWIDSNHYIDFARFVYIGIRDLDDAEKDLLTLYNIKFFDNKDVQRCVDLILYKRTATYRILPSAAVLLIDCQ